MSCTRCGYLNCVCGESDPETIDLLITAARNYNLAEVNRRDYMRHGVDQRVRAIYERESDEKLTDLDVAVVRYCRLRRLP